MSEFPSRVINRVDAAFGSYWSQDVDIALAILGQEVGAEYPRKFLAREYTSLEMSIGAKKTEQALQDFGKVWGFVAPLVSIDGITTDRDIDEVRADLCEFLWNRIKAKAKLDIPHKQNVEYQS